MSTHPLQEELIQCTAESSLAVIPRLSTAEWLVKQESIALKSTVDSRFRGNDVLMLFFGI
ncbi:hypothetical protein ACQVBX_01905 [Dyella sp. KULCS107]|uniref:hypothetical protein n=1 Tax=Dyella sp. KULCS107 TaxID=3422216 RepID=UPI003D700957